HPVPWEARWVGSPAVASVLWSRSRSTRRVYGRAEIGLGSREGRFGARMGEQAEKAERFLELHQGERPLLLPNPWDAGSARLLASLGFEALATTSSGS